MICDAAANITTCPLTSMNINSASTTIVNVADQTALAARDVDKIVEETISSVSASVMGVDNSIQETLHWKKIAELLSKIIERVEPLSSRFELVNDERHH